MNMTRFGQIIRRSFPYGISCLERISCQRIGGLRSMVLMRKFPLEYFDSYAIHCSHGKTRYGTLFIHLSPSNAPSNLLGTSSKQCVNRCLERVDRSHGMSILTTRFRTALFAVKSVLASLHSEVSKSIRVLQIQRI